MTEEYTAWIPTNNGLLQEGLIANTLPPESFSRSGNGSELKIAEKNTDAYSDTVFKEHLLKELPVSYDLQINVAEEPWRFYLCLTVTGKEVVTASGRIEKNGIVVFSVETKNIKGDESNIANTVFTILKNGIHGNNHHDQKVDTIIPIQPAATFEYSKVAYHLSTEIKRFEVEAKRIMRDNPALRGMETVSTLAEKAKGFKSYYDSFCTLFRFEIAKESTPVGQPENVLNSLDAIKKQVEAKAAKSRFVLATLLSIGALFISLNILAKPAGGIPLLSDHQYMFALLTMGIPGVVLMIINHIFIGLEWLQKVLDVTDKEKYQKIYLYCEALKIYKRPVPEGKRKYCLFYRAVNLIEWILIPLLLAILWSIYR